MAADRYRAGHTKQKESLTTKLRMMKTQNCHFTKAFLFICTVLILACSKENDDAPIVEPDPVYIVSNLDTTIEENPETGTVLGTLTTDLPGTLTYVSSNAAFDLDVASLEVFVADMVAFDYELNTSVTGTITLSNGEDAVSSTITITLTDFVDAIEMLLTTSKDAYTSASPGDWVEITSSEFELLESELEEVKYSGTPVDEYSFTLPTGVSLGSNDSTGFTIANITDATITPGSYIFAIRFISGTGIFEVTEGNRIKVSETSVAEDYITIGNPLPEKTSSEREVFFVLKGNTTATTTTGHLALYMGPANGVGRKDSSRFFHFGAGDLSMFSADPMEGATYAYQGLSTTKIQWD